MPKLSSKNKSNKKLQNRSIKKSSKKQKRNTKLSGKNSNISMGKLARAFSVANQGEALIRIIKKILDSSENVDRKLKKELARLPLFKGITNRNDISEKLLQMAQDLMEERNRELYNCSRLARGHKVTKDFYNNLINKLDDLGIAAMDNSTNNSD